MDAKQALEGFNKSDLWLYYAQIINDELDNIYNSQFTNELDRIFQGGSFRNESTIHTLDNGDKLYLNPQAHIFRNALKNRKGDFGAEYYILATDDPNKGDIYFDEEEKKEHEDKQMFNKVITLKAALRYIHSDQGVVFLDDIERLMDITKIIHRYGEENATKNIKREIDMNDVLVDDKYLLVCTKVDFAYDNVHIRGKLVEDGNVVASDLGPQDQGWVFTITLEVIDESVLRPPVNSQELGGEEYEEAKYRFTRRQ